jgi:formylglycine-generating enzyme required for sulfatase activity
MQPLRWLASPELADLFSRTYYDTYHARARRDAGELRDARIHFARQLAAPTYREGIRNLLHAMQDLEIGGAYLGETYRQQHPNAPDPLTMKQILLYIGEALVLGDAAKPLLQFVWERTPQQATPEPETEPPRAAVDRRRVRSVRTQAGELSIPVTIDQWRYEATRSNRIFGGTSELPLHYWCYVRAGHYYIGGWGDDTVGQFDGPGADLYLPEFWIARLPITNAQYRAFIDAGGYNTRRWWTGNGWEWRRDSQRTHPYWWDDPRFDHSEQPVVGVTWYEASAYCAWLTAQVGGTGVIRLPTEAEWEAAAAYDGQMQRRRYPWGDRPAPETEHADFARLSERGALPVGGRPAGAAACSALDMVGTVWEMAGSSLAAYPGGSATIQEDVIRSEWDIPWRGGGWDTNARVRCAARDGNSPYCWFDFNNLGLRVLFSPRVQ